MNIILKIRIFVVLGFLTSFVFGAQVANAQGFGNIFFNEGVDQMVWGGYHDDFQDTTGLSPKDPREMIVGFIRIALGFLGILSVTIIMMAGFKWMLSSGNEDKAAEAKTMMFNGLIGLIIILASLSLANFVIGSILNATRVF